MNYNRSAENAVMVLVATYMFTNDTNIDKKIAQITLQYVSLLPDMTVEEMANTCGVSVSSYLRFCRRMGYLSFTEFKLRIAGTLSKYPFIGTTPIAESFSEENFFRTYRNFIIHDFNQLQDMLDHQVCHSVVESLYKARTIYIVDLFYSTIRFALHGDLSVTGKKVFFLQPSDELYAYFDTELDENSLVFVFLDGTARSKINAIIPLCKEKKAHVSVFSCTGDFLYANQCDELLLTGIPTSPVSSIMIHDLGLHYLSVLYRKYYISK